MNQSYEKTLQNSFFKDKSEKTFIDKVLARRDYEELKALMKKEDLNRSDMLEILHALAGMEMKLTNLDDWDRYLLGKFFVWIREVVNLMESFYDFSQELENSLKIIELKIENEEDGKKKETYLIKIDYYETVLDDVRVIRNKLQHSLKFLADIFLYLQRSTLGVSAKAFEDINSNKYEYEYNQKGGGDNTVEMQRPRGR